MISSSSHGLRSGRQAHRALAERADVAALERAIGLTVEIGDLDGDQLAVRRLHRRDHRGQRDAVLVRLLRVAHTAAARW
jgi:hypothetical protein